MKKIFSTVLILLASLLATAQNELMNVYSADGTTILFSEPVYKLNKITFIPLVVGTTYQGGVIAYIFQAGDPGYVADEVHGLIATTADLSDGIQWSSTYYRYAGATGTAIGTGLTNTNTIVAERGTELNAAKLCSDHVVGAYTDWFLPSQDELQKLYDNRVAIGGFTTSFYWSSTEYDLPEVPFFGIRLNFSDGVIDSWSKDLAYAVRAVRTF